MGQYSVQTLISELEGILHGTSSNQIQNLYGVINRAARQVLLDVDPQETKRTLEFVNPIFNTVYQYPIAADVKGNKIIDIFPQVQRLPRDIWIQQYNQAFDVAKQNVFSLSNMFTMNFNTGIKTIEINAPFLNPPVVINQIESLTDNGIWIENGSITNLAINNTNYIQGSGSLQFDMSASVGYISNSTMSPVDLSTVVNQSSLFLWIYVPTGSFLNDVTLFWGSSPADFYSYSQATNQQGVFFVNGWNLCQFPWNSPAVTISGSPNPAAINYVAIQPDINSAMTGMLVNGLDSILGSILSYEYYSKYMFRDASTGAFQETVTDNSNLINLDTESYNLMVYKVAELAVQQQQGLDASFYDGPYFTNQYQEALARYKAMYKAENQKPQGSYYPINKPGYGRFISGWNW